VLAVILTIILAGDGHNLPELQHHGLHHHGYAVVQVVVHDLFPA
jgi:hypothetical protein